jgi:hypothetical protein
VTDKQDEYEAGIRFPRECPFCGQPVKAEVDAAMVRELTLAELHRIEFIVEELRDRQYANDWCRLIREHPDLAAKVGEGTLDYGDAFYEAGIWNPKPLPWDESGEEAER